MRGFSLMLVTGWLSSCSLLVQFDPETQPCDIAGACNPGFFCSDAGLCKAEDGGLTATDAGAPDASTCTVRETLCGDGRDNDCDMLLDCVDPDCGGVACDDRDSCTTGETCFNGSCPRGSAVICNSPPNPCQAQNGSCEAGTGRCLYNALPDGTACGAGASSRCCTGTCINTSVNGANCGGCGLACATQQVCQTIDLSGCMEPTNTSGRCTCSTTSPSCPDGQTCTNGTCRPALVMQCAPSQTIADGGTCGNYCRY